MPRELGIEVRVGFFVFTALVCLAAFIFSISDFSIFKSGKTGKVSFSFVNGLKKNAPVRVAGVDLGHVRMIDVVYDTVQKKANVVVTYWLSGNMMIPVDSRFFVNQLGILGEKYLEIIPGKSEQFILESDVVLGDDPIAMDEMSRGFIAMGSKLTQTLSYMNETLKTLNEGFLSIDNKNSVSAVLSNIAMITHQIKEGHGSIGKFLMGDDIYQNLEEFSMDLKANPWKLFYRPKHKK